MSRSRFLISSTLLLKQIPFRFPSIPGRFTTDFRQSITCQTMPLVGGFSRDLPFPPFLHFGGVPYSPHFTLVDSQGLAVPTGHDGGIAGELQPTLRPPFFSPHPPSSLSFTTLLSSLPTFFHLPRSLREPRRS
ncbi:hypothetical protein PR048_003882 [Dryococelus australis]|uniref:Uncharacterized protein n=1 Tax=Dryococelus australis TaxID=614101 RepID=A0ABQ9IPR2_9NEOP|nr:hypothetical protein PR048_003882 [Dryococelus australis]